MTCVFTVAHLFTALGLLALFGFTLRGGGRFSDAQQPGEISGGNRSASQDQSPAEPPQQRVGEEPEAGAPQAPAAEASPKVASPAGTDVTEEGVAAAEPPAADAGASQGARLSDKAHAAQQQRSQAHAAPSPRSSAATAAVLGSDSTRLVPSHRKPDPADAERLDAWGFTDSGFTVTEAGEVAFKGSRYEAISGKSMPRLFPWVQKVMEVELDPFDRNPSNYPPEVPAPVPNEAFLQALREAGFAEEQITQEPRQRLRRGHGHTQEEVWAIKYGKIERVPDVVVFPAEEAQVEALVQLALTHDVMLLPFGGGTNVTDALRCPENETRMIAALDMRRMNRIHWIDSVNRTAYVEAGAVGRDIMAALEPYGLTIGHEPDSVELSTLGGWIATNASGMKKNRYGNIEEIVQDLRMVGTHGVVERHHVGPRESIGPDPRMLAFGSEGNYGIITGATVKLYPLPEVQQYGSVLFPTFEDGLAFAYELTQSGQVPASVRLVDNMQFQFSMALKPAKKGALAKAKSKFEQWLVTKVKKFNPDEMVACTLVFEGTKEEVRQQRRAVNRLAKRHKGMAAGSDNGKRGYALTFAIAYIRDFVLEHWVIAESFETSVSWTEALALCENVKKRLVEECAKRGIPGKPYVTCRVTQLYASGVCVYFYFAFYYKGLKRPSETFAELEGIAREEVLRNGGTLSHHHGIGKIRARFVPQILSEAGRAWNRETKHALDQRNIFGARNAAILDEPSPEGSPPQDSL